MTKKHRKFAKNDTHFTELDQLLDNLQRPLLPDPKYEIRYPPCHDNHTKSADSVTCSWGPDVDSDTYSQTDGQDEEEEDEDGQEESEEEGAESASETEQYDEED